VHVSGFVDYLNPTIQDLLGPCDIITVQRNVVSEEVLNAIRYWQGMNVPTCIDLDDAYWRLVRSNPAFRYWIEHPDVKEPEKEPLVVLERGLRMCNALTSPNRLILKDWAHVTRGYHLPNFAREEWWTGLPTREELKAKLGLTGRTVIGWGGSVSHYDSWWGSGLREAATAISRRHPEVLWLICGNDPRIHDQLPVSPDCKRQQGGVPPNDWPKLVSSFDIGVAPLSGIYDQRRSWIKTLEYGLAGAPWVATAGEPYGDHAFFGKLVRGDPDEWQRAIEATLLNLSAEQAAAEQRIPLYRQWLIGNQLGTYEQVFNNIISDFQVDTASLPGIHFVNWPVAGKQETITAAVAA